MEKIQNKRKNAKLFISGCLALMLGITTIIALMNVDNSTIASGGVNSNIQISTGMDHSLAIVDGKLYAWGNSMYGQVGDGTTNGGVGIPVRIGNETNWVNVSAGNEYSLAINSLGELWAWGINHYGQLGNGNGGEGEAPYDVEPIPLRIGTETNWVSVSAGGTHSLAINALGELYAWGAGWAGELGDGTGVGKSIPTKIGMETNWVNISAGNNCSFAINDLGELYAWGYNWAGQLGFGYKSTNYPYYGVTTPSRIGTATDWVNVSAGSEYSLAINDLGELYAWGTNYNGQLGLGDSGNGTDRIVPTRVGAASNWKTATAGSGHSHAINTDGELWVWGSNASGQLGDGTIENKNVPTKIETETKWISVSVGSFFSIAISDYGEYWAWGNNYNCELGFGYNAAPILEPTKGSIIWYPVDTAYAPFGCSISYHSLITGYPYYAPEGSSYTFTIRVSRDRSCPIVKLNTANGKLALISINNNVYTYTVSNVQGEILATDFTVAVSRIA